MYRYKLARRFTRCTGSLHSRLGCTRAAEIADILELNSLKYCTYTRSKAILWLLKIPKKGLNQFILMQRTAIKLSNYEPEWTHTKSKQKTFKYYCIGLMLHLPRCYSMSSFLLVNIRIILYLLCFEVICRDLSI